MGVGVSLGPGKSAVAPISGLWSRLARWSAWIHRQHNGKETPLDELLAEMEAYDWSSIPDLPPDREEKTERLAYIEKLLDDAGLELSGSVSDLASGATSIGYLYPDVVAVDSDPRKIKQLCRDNIRGVIASIDDLPFPEKSFDYVVAISPPLKTRILHRNGYVSFTVDREYCRKLVGTALKIAREKVLIASLDIALNPPFEGRIERRELDNYYYVLYKAA